MESFASYSPAFFRALVDNVADGIYFVDLHRNVLYWNRAAAELTGYSAEEVVGRRCGDELLMHCDGGGKLLCSGGCPLQAAIEAKQTTNHEVYVRRRDGSRAPVSVTATPMMDGDGKVVGVVEIFRDNRAKLAADARAEEALHLAMRDGLTGLANRRFGEDYIEQYLADPDGAPAVFLLIDLDHFKRVNDRYGHHAGDEVLKTMGRTIAACVRPDTLACRWGGEEFVVFAPNCSAANGQSIAERIRVMVSRSVVPVGERHLVVTCSIGGTELRGGEALADVLNRADRGLYVAKGTGRDCVVFEDCVVGEDGEEA